ncbi:envelope glycoprotein D [Psittacid alphaherpesvirus 5]|uniref:Envelope glycoprotein D n=1 Tax=Psittacid alphaherpesvirus 5 TaxID=2972693 RepID=A0A5P9JTQ3_9ALPH|nr:envelope glycoprotein D [Psittacid alphaherpesvirus 5]QFU14615.1 envelope glycoprotein D [Psittacid alphaherpesvirus 5]UOO01086.1 envelope glycoprotein D [Psittacid alphaherpesvirus 5]
MILIFLVIISSVFTQDFSILYEPMKNPDAWLRYGTAKQYILVNDGCKYPIITFPYESMRLKAMYSALRRNVSEYYLSIYWIHIVQRDCVRPIYKREYRKCNSVVSLDSCEKSMVVWDREFYPYVAINNDSLNLLAPNEHMRGYYLLVIIADAYIFRYAIEVDVRRGCGCEENKYKPPHPKCQHPDYYALGNLPQDMQPSLESESIHYAKLEYLANKIRQNYQKSVKSTTPKASTSTQLPRSVNVISVNVSEIEDVQSDDRISIPMPITMVLFCSFILVCILMILLIGGFICWHSLGRNKKHILK